MALGVHPTRSPLFSIDERLHLMREVSRHLPNVKVESFDGLLIEYCKQRGARVIVRGLRAATDFEYELQIAHANADLEPDVQNNASHEIPRQYLSSDLARELLGWAPGGTPPPTSPAPA